MVIQLAKNVVKPLLSSLAMKFKDFIERKCDDFLKNLNNIYIQKEFLNMQGLIEIAQKNIVPNSNQVCAWLKKDDKTCTIFLAYANNRELLPENLNKYIAIEVEGISRDVENLFGDNELILLQ